ncbi:hypothetical protein JQX13_16475 [Archangium violaceum]|uniref:hypothetical protein n=1 Tax=Archangium violaceum TaxID=83451 RepID=UPI00193BAC5F|nr:hypothetical protein [Archangium violaceum]QRK11523.1 hypothetical protein JQX13_16475 [Archangium violaceum]
MFRFLHRLFNGENIVLQRLGGKLIFNADSSYWADENWLQSRLTVPFECCRTLSGPIDCLFTPHRW